MPTNVTIQSPQNASVLPQEVIDAIHQDELDSLAEEVYESNLYATEVAIRTAAAHYIEPAPGHTAPAYESIPAPYPVVNALFAPAAQAVHRIGNSGSGRMIDGEPVQKKPKRAMPRIADRDVVLIAEPHESVEDVLLRCFTYLPIKLPCNFHIRDVSQDDSFSAEHGKEMSCWQWTLDSNDVTRLSTMLNSDLEVVSDFHSKAVLIERSVGLPALPFPSKKYVANAKKDFKGRPLDEIMARLLKYRKKAARELKELRQIYPDMDEPQSPRVIGAITILTWLFNNGTNVSFEAALDKLRKLIIVREREKMFYILRHPENNTMHKAQDGEILEQIQQMLWFFNNINPLGMIQTHGYSTYHI